VYSPPYHSSSLPTLRHYHSLAHILLLNTHALLVCLSSNRLLHKKRNTFSFPSFIPLPVCSLFLWRREFLIYVLFLLLIFFFLLGNSLSISCRVCLLGKNPLSFCSFEETFISPLLLKNTFTKHRTADHRLFFHH